MERTTITIRRSTKQLLELVKGDKDWDSFFLEVYRVFRARRKLEALKRLRELVTEDDLKKLEEAIGEVRVKWNFKG